MDITPCHDADGGWNPTEACGGFPTEMVDNGSRWGAQCEPADVSPPSATCGPAWEDPDPTGGLHTSGGQETTGDATTADAFGTGDEANGTTRGETGIDGTGDPSAVDPGDRGCSTDRPRTSGWLVLLLLAGLGHAAPRREP
ncbi:MAG: hypothetical protein AAF721_42305 [Myxococcota bacterium]